MVFLFNTMACLLQWTVNVSLVSTLQRNNTENSKQIFSEMELCGHSPNFHIHVSVGDYIFPPLDLPILLQENMWTDRGNI